MTSFRTILTAAALAACSGMAAAQVPVDTGFSYQGRLTDAGSTPTGLYDFQFDLYDAESGGNFLGSAAADDVQVNAGLFTTTLILGPQFATHKRWLQLSVRPGASFGAYTQLAGRQLITGAPYSTGPWQVVSGFSYPSNGFYLRSGDNSYFGMDADFGDLHVNGGTDGSFGIFSEGPLSGSFNINAGGANRFTIKNSNGNVGIGTNNPVFKLSVVTGSGDTAVFGQSDGGGYGVMGSHNSSSNYGLLGTTGEGIYGFGNIGHGITAAGIRPGLAGSALSVSNSNTAGIAITASVQSSDATAVLVNDGGGDILKCFSKFVSPGDAQVFRVARNGNVYVGAYGSSPFGNSFPAISFGDPSGEGVGSWRDATAGADQQNGLSFRTAFLTRGYFTNGGDFKVLGGAFKPGGGSWSVASDQRLKKDIRPLDASLEKVLSLQGVSFEYIDPEAISELSGRRIGLIAQDVEQVFPDWVSQGTDGIKRLTIRGFEALAIESLRELRAEKDAQVHDLSLQVEALRAANDQLLARLERLETRPSPSPETAR